MNLQKCEIGYRICIKCKETKPLTEEFFYKDKNRKEGLMYRCKLCDKQRKETRIWAERKNKFTYLERKPTHRFSVGGM